MAVSQGTRFVGREAEIDVLHGDLAAALHGDGQLVLLVGEPGIGKTRTATALAAEARARGASVVWGRSHETGGAPAYWPWVQALGAYVDERGAAPVGEVAAVLPVLRAGAETAATDDAPDRARFELFDRVATALGAAARARPLVVVLDDLHWADAGSLLLLDFVARELGTVPLLVVGTLRDAEIARADAAPLLSRVARLGRSVRLAGLARAAVQEILAERLGRTPEEGVVEQVLALTDGNPFFVIEVAHLLTAGPSGGAGGRALPAVPPGIQELLRRRLEPLPEPSRRALDAAAVMGREFELGPLARVLGAPPEAVLEALGPALALGVVRDVPGALQRYAFVHALMRETLYEGLAPVARVALHGAIADALEAAGAAGDERLPALAHHAFEAAQGREPTKAIRYACEAGGRARPHHAMDEAAGAAGDERLPALAHHAFEAAQGREPTKAIRYACEAGGRALHLLAFEEAARHFERALAAVAVTGNDAARLQALVGLGEALHGSGDPEGAERVFRDAVDVARRSSPTAFAETALRFSGARAELAILDVEVNGVLEEALAMLPPEPGALRARLMARLAAGINLQPGSEQRRKALSDEAARMARGLNDPQTLAFVLARRLIGLLGPDHLEERVATTDEILAAGPASRTAELEALVFRVDDLAERGDRTGLDHALTVFEQKVRAARQPFFRWTAVSIRAAMAILEGRFGDAEALANEAFALGQQVHTRTALLQFGQQIFMLRGWQGRLAEAEPMVTMGVAETGIVPAWRCALAEFYGVAGREAEAKREFEALAAAGFVDLPRDTTWLTSAVLLASTCTRLRDVRRAEQLYDLMRPFRGRIAIARPLVVLVNPIDDRLGMLATVLGRWDAAEAHFTDALRLAERMRALPWQATIRREWAELHRRRAGRGDRERGLALLDEAEAIARPIGMDLLVGWITESREALRRSESARPAVLTLVPRPAGPAATPPARAGTLRRDGDVWTVVFDGRTTHVRDMVGLAHLVRLLGEPGREVHAAELAAAVAPGAEDAPAARAVSGDAGVLLDAQARADYETRLRDAGAELAEARRMNDRGRSERLAEEMEFLAAELSRGFGLGGRARRAGSTAERARVSVTRAIKYAVDRLGEHDPALAEHLRVAVRTGTFCAYEPPDRDRVNWTL